MSTPVATLVVEKGKLKGKKLHLENGQTYLLGRDEDCHLILDADLLISRRHCQLECRNGRILIRDLGSSNGTYVNGKKVSAQALELGDRIQLGDTLLSLLEGEEDLRQRAEYHEALAIGYRLMKRIGRGGMGTVYLAEQLSLGRQVAIKILSREVARDPKFVNLFQEEAKACARLYHPHIVQVFEMGEVGGSYYLAMEYMEGGSVEDLLYEKHRLPWEQALKIVLQAAKGLEYAAQERIIHRDVKPANLMLTAQGCVKVGDLGIAKQLEGDQEQLKVQGISGSPRYIAPEHALGKPIDARVDIYSLGVTLYHLLTGRTPYEGSSPQEIILKHVEETPVPIRQLVPEIPPEVAALVERMMAKAPENRFPSMTEVIGAIETLLSTAESSVEELVKEERASSTPKVRSAPPWLSAFGVFLILLSSWKLFGEPALQRIWNSVEQKVKHRIESVERALRDSVIQQSISWKDAYERTKELFLMGKYRGALKELGKARQYLHTSSTSPQTKALEDSLTKMEEAIRLFHDLQLSPPKSCDSPDDLVAGVYIQQNLKRRLPLLRNLAEFRQWQKDLERFREQYSGVFYDRVFQELYQLGERRLKELNQTPTQEPLGLSQEERWKKLQNLLSFAQRQARRQRYGEALRILRQFQPVTPEELKELEKWKKLWQKEGVEKFEQFWQDLEEVALIKKCRAELQMGQAERALEMTSELLGRMDDLREKVKARAHSLGLVQVLQLAEKRWSDLRKELQRLHQLAEKQLEEEDRRFLLPFFTKARRDLRQFYFSSARSRLNLARRNLHTRRYREQVELYLQMADYLEQLQKKLIQYINKRKDRAEIYLTRASKASSENPEPFAKAIKATNMQITFVSLWNPNQLVFRRWYELSPQQVLTYFRIMGAKEGLTGQDYLAMGFLAKENGLLDEAEVYFDRAEYERGDDLSPKDKKCLSFFRR